MDPDGLRVAHLDAAARMGAGAVGNKAVNLARLRAAKFTVPDGFCIAARAYVDFVRESGIGPRLDMELGRKSLAASRWEELWDIAHRIRAAFLAAPVPADLAAEILAAASVLGDAPLAVRSSAPGEDSESRSHAGLHDSVVNVRGEKELLVAVRAVWASLWSDAALLYRAEIGLDPRTSRMAVVVQAMVPGGPSGVAFARDPRELEADRAIVEAVPGPCGDLVDGSVDPDRWVLRRSTGEIVDWRPGEENDAKEPLLDGGQLSRLGDAMARVEEELFGPPDLEWTFASGRLTLLQARPITAPLESGDEREWYLTLTPADDRLRQLARRVAQERIPALAAEGDRLALEDLANLDDKSLAEAIDERRGLLAVWRDVYRDEFIPLAHGVRRLASYYEQAVRPTDPYEFTALLTGQKLMAFRRNESLEALGASLRADGDLRDAVRAVAAGESEAASLSAVPGGEAFQAGMADLLDTTLDVEFSGERLGSRPDLLLHVVLEMSERDAVAPAPRSGEDLLAGLLRAVGSGREAEARELVEIGRLSWRLRDDDNLLLGRVESQVLRATAEGASRLVAASRLPAGRTAGEEAAAVVAAALRDPDSGAVTLPRPAASEPARVVPPGEKSRQLVGQPSSPGIATGRVCRIRTSADLGRFRAGDVLVCPAIQPSITHLVPLACAVIERRGGMLIHGAIIARELGIPCVNGIPDVVDLLEDGETVTVDGWLGIVTVGVAEFDLERVGPGSSAEERGSQ